MAYLKAQLSIPQYEDVNGNPLSGGSINAYIWDTSTPTPMYTSSAGAGSATSFTLNSLGQPMSAGGTAVDIFLDTAVTYKFILKDSSGTQVGAAIGPVYASYATSTISSTTVTATGATAAISLADRFAMRLNVKDFGAVGDGTTDDTAAIQAAITAVGAGRLYFPPGTYKITSTLNMARYLTIEGAGYKSSIISYNGTGAGLKMASTINTSTGVYTRVCDIQIKCTNGSNAAGGYEDICGTYVNLDRCFITGFKYGVVFDQTELADITSCVIDSNTTAQIWLADGNYTPGASSQYTNRISVSKCQISGASTQYGILDDGGYTHSFVDNNFNGLKTHIRACGVHGIKIDGGEYESANTTNIVFSNLDVAGGSHGQPTNICVTHAVIVPTPGNYCIDIVSAGNITLIDNFYGNSSAAAVHGCANTNSIFSSGNLMAGVNAMFDAKASYHVSFDGATTGAPLQYPYNSAAINESASGFVLGTTGTRLLAGAVNSLNQIYFQGVNPGVGYTRSILLQPLGGRVLMGGSSDDGTTMCQLTGAMSMTAIAAASAQNNTLFRDSADGKLKWKDNGGVVNALY